MREMNVLPKPTYLCPFCQKPCAVGWDCECGAKALPRAPWIVEGRPLMKHQDLIGVPLMLRLMRKEYDDLLRVMTREE